MQRVFINNEKLYNEYLDYLSENPIILEKNEKTGYLKTDEYEFFVSYQPKENSIDIVEETDNLTNLIFGKDRTEFITAIEIEDDKDILIFKDGTIEKRDHVYWLLTEVKLDNNFERLGGNQHYKWIRKFSDKEEYYQFRGLLSKKRIDYYCVWNEKESAMIYHGITLFSGMKVSDVSVLSFDIEADSLVETKNSRIFLITNTFKKDNKIIKKHFRLDHYDNCGELITDWCNWVREIDPTIINGHNIFGYDFRYLNHVAKLNQVSLDLGRDGSVAKFGKKSKKYRVDGSQTWEYNNVEIYGRHIIDGMFLAVKYDIGRNYPSWGLKPIAEYEGLVKEDRQFYDASLIGENWDNPVEREKIIAYGIDDSDDSLALYELMIPSFFYTAQSIPKPFQTVINSASGAWLNTIMVRSYLQEGESIPKASEGERVAGGMSYGVAGVYSNVSKWDAASYYPNTILTFNIYDKVKDPKANYYEMVKYFTEKRFEQKGKYKETGDSYYNDLQAASKVFINSAYGLLGTRGLNFNSFENASLITKCCRKGLQKCIKWATGKDSNYWWKDYEEEQDFTDYSFIDSKSEWSYDEMKTHNWDLVNIDTDSLSFVKKDNSAWTKEEYDMIYDEINKIMYSAWEDDGQFERFVVVKAKNYAMLSDGKFKIKGSAFIDAKKEPIMRQMLERGLKALTYENEDVFDVYLEHLKLASNITDISPWVVKKSITETLLEANDTTKRKVLNAIGDKPIQVGDKVFLFNDIDGEIQKVEKGEKKFTKMKKKEYEELGLTRNPKTEECDHSDRVFCMKCNPHLHKPKMIPNRVLRLQEDFYGTYELEHYISRVFKTIKILEPVLDFDKYLDYSKAKNKHLLGEII